MNKHAEPYCPWIIHFTVTQDCLNHPDQMCLHTVAAATYTEAVRRLGLINEAENLEFAALQINSR